jgi:hypothetical protein
MELRWTRAAQEPRLPRWGHVWKKKHAPLCKITLCSVHALNYTAVPLSLSRSLSQKKNHARLCTCMLSYTWSEQHSSLCSLSLLSLHSLAPAQHTLLSMGSFARTRWTATV